MESTKKRCTESVDEPRKAPRTEETGEADAGTDGGKSPRDILGLRPDFQ
jgi:hypothetical protein